MRAIRFRGRVSAVTRWLTAVVATLALALTACGREGGASALPNKPRFCRLAVKLSNEASAALAPLGVGPSLPTVAQTLKSFFTEHSAEYADLDSSAPPEVRPALQSQRAAQRAFFTATAPDDLERAYLAAVRSGAQVRQYEARACSVSA